MKIINIGKTVSGQDGAIYNKLLFRFSASGECHVYGLDAPSEAIDSFVLDKAEKLAPHSNAVVFGSEFYSSDDEFPLLYTNIYNNYADKENNYCGVCCVYRLWREEGHFKTALVQLIKIGFTDDVLWRSSDVNDVRPWGNFVIDNDNKKYYAFVMRDGDKKTRYFSFNLPTLADGENVTLTKEDVLGYFDVPYHNYLQGACFRDGKIYEVEGFNEKIRPALRIIDTVKKEQIFHVDLYDEGAVHEPELIDFADGRCIYGDNTGSLFELEF